MYLMVMLRVILFGMSNTLIPSSLYILFCAVVRALVPRMNLDELFEQKGEVARAVLEELEKVISYIGLSCSFCWPLLHPVIDNILLICL